MPLYALQRTAEVSGGRQMMVSGKVFLNTWPNHRFVAKKSSGETIGEVVVDESKGQIQEGQVKEHGLVWEWADWQTQQAYEGGAGSNAPPTPAEDPAGDEL